MKIYRFVALLCLLATASTAFAQGSLDSYIELLRSDLQTQKTALITEALQFTDDEAKAFWPMYREYELEGSKLMDRRVAALKDYAANYETMDDKKADELIKGSFEIQTDRISLREKYYKKKLLQLDEQFSNNKKNVTLNTHMSEGCFTDTKQNWFLAIT